MILDSLALVVFVVVVENGVVRVQEKGRETPRILRCLMKMVKSEIDDDSSKQEDHLRYCHVVSYTLRHCIYVDDVVAFEL